MKIMCIEITINNIKTAAMRVVEQNGVAGEKIGRLKEMASHFVMLK
jgi:hypothetical protein